jgi:O-antigen/teichoic acid export membrane protein
MWRKQARLFVIFAAAGVPLALFLMAAAPGVYRLLLGKAFAGSVPVFQILVAGRLVSFLGQAYGPAIPAMHLDSEALVLTTAVACCSVALTLIVAPLAGIVGVAYVILFSELVMQSSCYYVIRRHRERHFAH